MPAAFLAASYLFRLEQFHIDNTRAPHEDTDTVSFALKVGDKVYGPQIKHMGDVNNGDHPVNLEFGPVIVDDPSTQVIFNYQIVNSGHQSGSEIDTALTSGALALFTKYFGPSSVWGTIAAGVVQILKFIFDLDCDGPVAVDQVSLTGGNLWAGRAGSACIVSRGTIQERILIGAAARILSTG